MTVSEGESDNIKTESDFLISSLGFNDVLITALPAFGAWGTETTVIQELRHPGHPALNGFAFLAEAFLKPAFVIFDDYYVIQILINNIVQSSIE